MRNSAILLSSCYKEATFYLTINVFGVIVQRGNVCLEMVLKVFMITLVRLRYCEEQAFRENVLCKQLCEFDEAK